MAPEQKEKNKQYVLDHFEEYVLDSHGNFANSSPDVEGNEWFFCFGKDSFAPEGYEELKTKLFETILKEIKDWELSFVSVVPEGTVKEIGYFIHKPTKRKISKHAFDFEKSYQIIGELGYRKNIWENYEERKKWFQENITNYNNQPTQPQNEPNKKPEQQQPSQNQNNSPSENTLPQTLNQEKPNKEHKDNPSSPEKEQNPSTNNPLPSPSEIQDNYNSDKDKLEIDNNSNLTTPEQKKQTNEFLKTVISGELLTKKKQFNSECLTKLITEKKHNTALYQLLNKEGRVDKVINQLESIKNQSKKGDINPLQKNKGNDQIPAGIIVIVAGGAFLLFSLGIMIARRRKIKH